MAKRKRKLTPAEKAEKKRRKAEYMTIFVGGKQKRVKRPPMIEGMTEEEFIRANADPVWLHQHEMWEELTVDKTGYSLSAAGILAVNTITNGTADSWNHTSFPTSADFSKAHRQYARIAIADDTPRTYARYSRE